MSDVARLHPETREVVQAAQEAARREEAEAEAALLEAFPEPLHELSPATYGDTEEGATWVHLMSDHEEPVHSLDYAKLGELRAVHAAAHAAEDDNGETLVEAIVSAVIESLLENVRADCDCADRPRPCPSCGRVEYGLELGSRRAVLIANRVIDR